jgi:hypothetical protein
MSGMKTAFLAGAGAASLALAFIKYNFSIKKMAKAEAISEVA